MNNETFRDNSASAAPDGVLTRAGRRPPTAQQRETLVLTMLKEPHFGRACDAAGISRAAGYRLVNTDTEVAEALKLARDVYLRDLLDAVYDEAVRGRALVPTEGEPARIRDNRLLAAALRTLLGSPAVAVQVNQNNQPGAASPASDQLDPERRARLDQLLRGRVLEGEADDVTGLGSAAPESSPAVLRDAPIPGESLPLDDGSDLI